jgi:mRNA export factor
VGYLEIEQSPITFRVVYQHTIPDDWILSCTWAWSNNYIAFGGASGRIHLLTRKPSASPPTLAVYSAHNGPVSCLGFDWGSGPLISASWDGTLKYWTAEGLEHSKPAEVIQLPERAFCMDVRQSKCVVALGPGPGSTPGTTTSFVALIDVPKNTITVQFKSPLRYQSRSITLFANAKGFLLGGIEGRCAIVNFDEPSADFAFKCHRDTAAPMIYAVNCLAMHPLGTFATGGGDGTFHFWDKDARMRLKTFPTKLFPFTAMAFNRSGSLLAFASGEDWQRGDPGVPKPSSLTIIPVGAEIKPKTKTPTKK